MQKILVLYFSGVGTTKKIAKLIHSRLSQNCNADIFSIESKDVPSINSYDSLIIGTPTYHAAPSRFVVNFISAVPQLSEEIPAFIFKHSQPVFSKYE